MKLPQASVCDWGWRSVLYQSKFYSDKNRIWKTPCAQPGFTEFHFSGASAVPLWVLQSRNGLPKVPFAGGFVEFLKFGYPKWRFPSVNTTLQALWGTSTLILRSCWQLYLCFPTVDFNFHLSCFFCSDRPFIWNEIVRKIPLKGVFWPEWPLSGRLGVRFIAQKQN